MKNKNNFWKIFGGAVAILGVSFFAYKQVKNKNLLKEQAEKDKLRAEEVEKLDENTQGTEAKETKKGDVINPSRNVDRAINNKFSDIRGVLLYPAKKSNNPIDGHPYASGFANIRENAEVNTERGIVDLWTDNLLGTVRSGASIGTIASERYDNLDPAMRWFMVKLTKPLDGWKYGWVRADVVTFKPFVKGDKKSNFYGDENMVVRYDNSYQLGAEVFPH